MRPERFRFLCTNAREWKPHLTLWPATNGTHINVQKWIQNGLTTAAGAKRLRRGELGCADSHVRAWQAIADDEKRDMGIVAEDDASIVPSGIRMQQLRDTLDELNALKINWDLLYLEYRNVFGYPPRASTLTANAKHVFMPKGCQCLYMYILTKAGAKKLLATAKPYVKPIDVYVAEMSDTDKIVSLCMTPAFGKVKNIFSDTAGIR